jgi:hypothetical protein
MTSSSESGLRIIAFGDLRDGVWGTVLDAGQPAIVFGTAAGTGSAAGAESVRLSRRDRDWELSGTGIELFIAPAERDGEPTARRAAADELCRVRGKVTVGGSEVRVDCPGTRSYDLEADPGRLDSARGIWGWFDDDQALALLALRPRGAAGQQEDHLAATLFDSDATIIVEEPRLSTTYTSDGLPSRASLELWIGEGEEQYPRRAAAEALGPGASIGTDGLTVQGSPLRCHSHGSDGPGVYLLARF